MVKKISLVTALAFVASILAVTLSATAEEHEFEYYPIATDEFFAVWERTDYPVEQLEVARTWIWGPGGFSDLLVEEYAEGEDGVRQVQYFDKSRMEMPTLGAADTDDQDSPWFITQGLLATELMTGQLQLGDDTFEQYNPSNRSAAGDPGDTTAPTYAAMGTLIERNARAGGEVIVEYANRDGDVVADAARFTGYGVTDVEGDWQDVEGIDKNIASVFWDFMTSQSIIYDAEEDDFVTDDLFLNAFYAVGYPLTDAFWADVTVDGDEQVVLIQCFERRCLTYTPGNPDGWEVESGNIGQHYYDWRYHQIPAERVLGVSLDVEAWNSEAVTDATVDDVDLALLIDDHEDRYVIATASLVDQFGNLYRVADEDIEFSATDGDGETNIRGGDGFNVNEPEFAGGQADNPLVVATDADGQVVVYFRRSLGQEDGQVAGVIDLTATWLDESSSDTVTVEFIEGDVELHVE